MSHDRFTRRFLATGEMTQCAFCRGAHFSRAHDDALAAGDPGFVVRNTPPRPVIEPNGSCTNCQPYAPAGSA